MSYQCDRCGKYYDKNTVKGITTQNEKKIIGGIAFTNEYGTKVCANRFWRLCDDCLLSVMHHLKKEKLI